MYSTFKFLHVLGVVFLVGNVTASAVWKVFANRTGDPQTIAFSQRLVTYTDWTFTGGGIVLVMAGGYGMTYIAGMNLLDGWLLAGQLLFLLSGMIWGLVLVPIQVHQARIARTFERNGNVGDPYLRLSRRWIVWGIVATVPLIAATYVMIAKP